MRNSHARWKFPDPIEIPGSFQLSIGGSPLVSETLYRRGYTSPDQALGFLDPAHYKPSPPGEIPGLVSAAKRVIDAICEQEQVLIWGDFDVDGQTSTSLLVSSLEKIGARVTHYIPNRSLESHGISVSSLNQRIQDISPQLIITCDTGIDAHDAIHHANQLGIDVVITDHHQLPPILPDAHAIVNPHTLPPDNLLSNLPGVGVAYKLIEEIYSHFSEDPTFLLDLVALGIVADVAIQTGDTRYLLQKGLELLRSSPRLGLLEIYNNSNLKPSEINEEHIGFLIGPRLNALGRLDDANSSVDFFTTNDPAQASFLAQRLEELNKTRQALTEEIFQDAENMISAYPELVEEYPVLVLQGSQQWNPGVIGIVASRLVERYQKPVIMLSQEGEQARGSARSIPGVPISELISASEDHLTSHGGHPMAAGVSLPLVNVSLFRRSIAENYHTIVGDVELDLTIDIDSEIHFQQIDGSFINDFQRLAPFGPGNPKLIFATRGVFTDPDQVKPIGRTGTHRKLSFKDSNEDRHEFLWWNSKDLPIPAMPLDIAYSLSINTYRNQSQIQATLLHLRQSPQSPIYIPAQTEVKIIDLRGREDHITELTSTLPSPDTIIWAESKVPGKFPSVPRSELSRRETLIIWTSPASRFMLNQVITKVSPTKIIIIGIDPDHKTLDDFIHSLLGLLKHIDRTKKPYNLSRFAEILALPEDVIEIGIDWVHHHGDLDLSQIDEGLIKPGPNQHLPGYKDIDVMLKHKLREIFAYRNYFRKAHLRAIL